mgnify:CR=1 FL=1
MIRLWDEENKRMIPEDEAFKFTLEEAEQFCKLRPAGISDKNGTAVYEGDFVKLKNMARDEKGKRIDRKVYFGTVTFEHCCFFLDILSVENRNRRLEMPEQYIHTIGYQEETEVLGNVYENSELLVKYTEYDPESFHKQND